MQIDILTIFPEMFNSPLSESIVKRAQDEGKVEINIHNLRDWSDDNYKSVDDRPYGGGAGMVMRVDVVDRAMEDLRKENSKVILLDTKGEFYHQGKAKNLAKEEHLILIVPHFEGMDHRVHEHISDEVICIGPYVLTGGELPAMIVVDSIVRLLPGVIKEESLYQESYDNFDSSIFESMKKDQEYPQYTRPAEYMGWQVPKVLLNGNHAEIDKWRSQK